MQDLVFLKPSKIGSEPFTTSDIIAECTGNNYRSVQRLIERQIDALRTFGRVRFEITPLKTRGGIQNKKVYLLNEPQATLLITFLKNTPVVVKFKTELVRQFYLMRAELQKRQISKLERKPIRRELTDVIQSDPNHSKWDYKLYTDLAYKTVLGKSAAQIRRERGAKPHDTASDYMTSEEIGAIAKLESQISVLKELGMDYYQIKGLLLNRKMIGNVA